MNLDLYKHIYLIGVGGIGMSALARYFNSKGQMVYGYDKVKSELCIELETEGINIHYYDDVNEIPEPIKEAGSNDTIVIYTPAISNEDVIFKFFKDFNFIMIKRSDLLASIVNNNFSVAIAGTHGKTTITAILSHILQNTKLNYTAFIGGITNDNNSNLNYYGDEIFIVEADEYDRSFLKLEPNIICINNIDGDHYDIYKDYNNLKKAFIKFTKRLKNKGILITNDELNFESTNYGFNSRSNFVIKNLRFKSGYSFFDLKDDKILHKDIQFNMLGKYNCINALAAIIISLKINISFEIIRESLKTFKGVKRRLSFELLEPKILIDDYAHHPKEIESVFQTLEDIYPSMKKLVIFQPHLFSRTRDFLDGFAKSLEKFDKVILLDIYPAREKPIEGITSKLLLDKIKNKNKLLLEETTLLDLINKDDSEIIITLGAGSIGKISESLKKKLLIEN